MKDRALWERIAAADFGTGPGGEDLAHAVAERTGWPDARIATAIHEYRRFLYLCALVARAKRVPGKPVDTVWQAHVAMGGVYEAFCRDLLGRTLPHIRVQGGQEIERTRKAYEREFGAAPPPGLWPDPNEAVYRVIAVLFAVGGIVGSVVGGSVWPGLVGVILSALVLFAPKRGGTRADDSAFWGMMSAGGIDGGGDSGSSAGGDSGGGD